MVACHLRARGIRDEAVLAAMANVPRELFVPASERSRAYADCPLSIGSGQTISQPYIVARMLELLDCDPDGTVLDVGTGSGYQAALLSRLAKTVFAVELLEELAARTAGTLQELGCENVSLIVADGSRGLPARAPFDRIICGAAAPDVPQSWKEQLADGGRIVAPVGGSFSQRLVVVTRTGEAFQTDEAEAVRFVPLLGEEGFSP